MHTLILGFSICFFFNSSKYFSISGSAISIGVKPWKGKDTTACVEKVNDFQKSKPLYSTKYLADANVCFSIVRQAPLPGKWRNLIGSNQERMWVKRKTLGNWVSLFKRHNFKQVIIYKRKREKWKPPSTKQRGREKKESFV